MMTGWPTGVNDSLRSTTFSLGSRAGLPLYQITNIQDGFVAFLDVGDLTGRQASSKPKVVGRNESLTPVGQPVIIPAAHCVQSALHV